MVNVDGARLWKMREAWDPVHGRVWKSQKQLRTFVSLRRGRGKGVG